MWLCILSILVSVCSQPAQAVTGKEAFTGVEAGRTCVNDGGINKRLARKDKIYAHERKNNVME